MDMDTGYENKLYQQIEQNLSNNDKLFVPIEIIDENTYHSKKNRQENTIQDKSYLLDNTYNNEINQIDTIGELKEDRPRISRAEYIRLAREACLKQMDATGSSSGASDIYFRDDYQTDALSSKKREKANNLFFDGSDEEALPEEVASYKSLIIRTVCALVIFAGVFIIDKMKLDWGAFSYETIQEYVTGNDKLKTLEDIIVTWLK